MFCTPPIHAGVVSKRARVGYHANVGWVLEELFLKSLGHGPGAGVDV